jgi:GT2 family glycosyltransferase
MIPNSKTNRTLTIVILNYNVRPFLVQCLKSLFKDPQSKNWRIIVVDNASTDDSVKYLKKHFAKKVTLITSDKNLGFSAGNNLAVKHIDTTHTLFLNPDTLVPQGTLPHMLKFMEENPQVGAVTCRVELPDGQLDDSCHRGFPTPWNSFCHFSGLAKIFPRTKLFTGYSLSYLLQEQSPRTKEPQGLHTLNFTNMDASPGVNGIQTAPHPIDALNGAFFLLRTKVGQQLNWWDEDYFWYGEDLDFCYRIKQQGWQIYYVPQVKIIHFKGASSGLYQTSKESRELDISAEEPRGLDSLEPINMDPSPEVDRDQEPLQPSRQTRLRSAQASTQAMRTFYRKHYQDKYPRILTFLTLLAIDILQKLRLRKYSN